MGTGTWFVMVPTDRVPSELQLKTTLDKIRTATVTRVDTMVFSVAVENTTFGVGLNDASWVVLEAKEFVDTNGAALANRDEVATYDARFELLFDHRDMGELFPYLLSAAEKLAKLTGGVVYEADNGVFQ